MKKIWHVVIWVLVVCFFACISPVAFAVDSDYSLWEWLLNKNIPWLGDLSGCTEAPAGNHNFQYIPGEGTFCTYCGISYSDYSAAAYQQTLNLRDSDGVLTNWRLDFVDENCTYWYEYVGAIYAGNVQSGSNPGNGIYTAVGSTTLVTDSGGQINFSWSNAGGIVVDISSTSIDYDCYYNIWFDGLSNWYAPVAGNVGCAILCNVSATYTGTYAYMGSRPHKWYSASFAGNYNNSGDVMHSIDKSDVYPVVKNNSGFVYRPYADVSVLAGDTGDFSIYNDANLSDYNISNWKLFVSGFWKGSVTNHFMPYICFTPLSTIDTPNKVGTITGDIVVIGDDNEVTVYENCQFVDETNNQYFNPTTNTWNTYNSYSYDYSTFTYNFTTDSGNTTINYGDEYVSVSETVNNVTNVYNYYYYVDGGGSGGDEDPTEVIGWLERIYNKLVDIGKTLLGIEGTVEDIEDQMPEGESSDSIVSNFFKSKFKWVDEVGEIGNSFITDITSDQNVAGRSSFSGNSSTAPVITIDFSAAESNYGYDYGGEVTALDLSWYDEYKSAVDGIMSGFLWLLFLWGLFKQAPNILAGMGITVNRPEDDPNMRYLPPGR